MLDFQFYADHEDLSFSEIYLNSFDLSNNNPSHGTHVAGTIAATFDNKHGIAGIARCANLYGASFSGLLDNTHTDSNGITVHAYEAGLAYLIAIKNCKVVNISLGGSVGDKVSVECIQPVTHIEKMLQTLLDEGYDFLIVKAAGNNRIEYSQYDMFSLFQNPNILNRIVTIGAAELGDCGDGNPYHIWNKSNYGTEVDIIAPGSNIYSTVCNGNSKGVFFSFGPMLSSAYDFMSGTSMAAPHVTGTAAAIWSVYPTLTGPEMKKILCSTAQGSYGYAEEISSRYPMLDAYAAIQEAARYSQAITGDADEPELQQEVQQDLYAYQAYLSHLEQERDAINAYYWQKGYYGSGTLTDAQLSRPVVFCDCYGDSSPEMIYIKRTDDADYWAHIEIVTYESGQVRVLYSGIWDTQVAGGQGYYFYQINGEKALYLYDSTGDDWWKNTYYYAEENADGSLSFTAFLQRDQTMDYSAATFIRNVDYIRNGESISEDEFAREEANIQVNTACILIYNAGAGEFAKSYTASHGCPAMTCDEAIAYLRGMAAIGEISTTSGSSAQAIEAAKQYSVNKIRSQGYDESFVEDYFSYQLCSTIHEGNNIYFVTYNVYRTDADSIIVLPGGEVISTLSDEARQYLDSFSFDINKLSDSEQYRLFTNDPTYQYGGWAYELEEQSNPGNISNSWSSAYQGFVLNRTFLNSGDSMRGYGDLENGVAVITFALHDMNGDNVPELIIFNGFNGRDLQANYVFTYTGSEIAYCGTTLASAYAVDGYPGLFSSSTSSGWYLDEQYAGQYAEVTYLDYHALYGDTVTKESVSVTGLPISEGGRVVISRTANNNALYEASQSSHYNLTTMTWQELNSNGWDSFVATYGGSGSSSQQEYLTSASDLTQASIENLCAQVNAVISNNVANSWGRTENLESSSYVGCYVLSNPNAVNEAKNYVIVVFKNDVLISIPNEGVSKQLSYYYTLKYSNVSMDANGNCLLGSYLEPDNKVLAGIPGHNYYYNGYDNLEVLYNYLIQPKLSDYDVTAVGSLRT